MITFTLQEAQTIVSSLGKLPYEQVAGVIDAFKAKAKEAQAAALLKAVEPKGDDGSASEDTADDAARAA